MAAVTRNENSFPIRPLVSETAGNAPDVADLFEHEVGVNIPDSQIFAKDSAGILHELIKPRVISVIDSDAAYTKSSFVRNKHEVSADLQGGEVVATYDEGLPDGFIIEANVQLHDGVGNFILKAGDGSVEKFRSNRKVVNADGSAQIADEGESVFVKDGLFWNQIKGRCSCMPAAVELSVSGSIDESDPYFLAVSINDAVGGSGVYADYQVTFDFLHPDQNSRQIVMNGLLTDAPSQSGFSGTLGSMVINNITADIYGEINITVVVTDNASATATGVL